MDTPDKEKLLETVRALRQEASEKLVGNRHDLAIQKLDDIIAVVEKQDMSPEEITAVSSVLDGNIEAAPSSESVEAVVENSQEVPAQESDNIIFEEGPAEAVSLPEIAATEQVVVDGNENIVDLASPEIEVQAVPEIPVELAQVSDEVMLESAPEVIFEEPSGSSLGTIAAVGAGALAAGALAKNLVGEAMIGNASEVELIDVPEGNIVPPDVGLAAIETPEVAMPGLDVVPHAPPVELVELTDVPDVLDVLGDEGLPVAAPELEFAQEAVIIETDPLDVLELDTEPFVPDVPTEEVWQEGEVVVPEIEVAAGVPEMVGAAVPVVDASPQISDILPDIDPAKAALVAAGAAATAAAVSAEQSNTEIAAAPEVTDSRGLAGSNIQQHPSYGGERGNWFVRFFNTLRGKDYL